MAHTTANGYVGPSGPELAQRSFKVFLNSFFWVAGLGRKFMKKKGNAHFACAMVLFCSFGCGRSDLPELAPVSGTVTLDGVPFPNAFVQFHTTKEKGGRPASGVTDAAGKYELVYLHGVDGAHIGTNKVEITTQWPDGEPPDGVTEPIPAKYNTKSTLTADVKDERNTIDFKLESETPKK